MERSYIACECVCERERERDRAKLHRFFDVIFFRTYQTNHNSNSCTLDNPLVKLLYCINLSSLVARRKCH